MDYYFQNILYFNTYATDESMFLISQQLEACEKPPISAPIDSNTLSSDVKKIRKRKKKNKVEQKEESSVLRKRKLTEEQAAFLELSFEKDRKLESDRKEQLAAELQLEPRQVAVWFQNRRARFKSQKLEDEFAKLTSSHDIVLAQKAQLEAQVLMLNEKLHNAENDLRRLSAWEGSDVRIVSSTPATSSLSTNHQTITSSLFLESPQDEDLGNGLYMLQEEHNAIPYMGWIEGLAI